MIPRSALGLALLFAGGCGSKLPDPPPPAQSHELPLAPPGARGAHAATLNPPALPTAPLWSDPDEADSEESPADAGGSGTDPDGGGVAL